MDAKDSKAKKLQLQLVPPALEAYTAVAMAEGAEKYGVRSWRTKGVSATEMVGAMLRHLRAYQRGQDVDPDSPNGKLHLAGIAASVAILLDAQENGSLNDDR